MMSRDFFAWRALVLGTCAAAACVLGGCVSSQNARTVIGPAGSSKGVQLTALSGEASGRGESAGYDDGASLAVGSAGMDRSGWGLVAIDAPFDSVGGTWRYTRDYRYTKTTARQRGDYPSPLSALELDGDTLESQTDEAIVNPLMHLTQATLLIPRMLMRAPWGEVSHMPQGYWRVMPTQVGGER